MMKYVAEIMVVILIFWVFTVLVVISAEYDKALKWGNIYKEKGRDGNE